MNAPRWAGALLMTAALVAQPVLAADDGGGRSVFARGAGERALAMGGAYGAVADDAPGLFWNPAGLARLDRLAFSASHTDLIGMGFYEQYGTVAVPSWRLGTFALALRRFGVDGIEGRDDRGGITDENLSDAETELSVGYARSLGEAWSIGAAVKFQQQELAGHSGGGLGLDVGVMVKPLLAGGGTSALAHGLSVGASFRNLIEPTITLVDDDVTDPGSVRLGTALELPAGERIRVLGAADVERTRDMDARFHAGLEVTLMNLLALRVGSHDGDLTAGTGVRWRDVAVNYTFEDNTLESVHRFGLGLRFGPTTDARRQASRDRVEQDINQRLEKTLADETSRRTRAMVAAISNSLAIDDHDEALARVQTLRVLEPDHPRADEFEAHALEIRGRAAEADDDLAGALVAYQQSLQVQPGRTGVREDLTRVQAESNRRAQRSLDIADRYAVGMEHYAAGKLDLARDIFQQIVLLDPNDSNARDMLGHVGEAIRTRDEAAAARLDAAAAVARASGNRPRTAPSATPTVTVGSGAAAPIARPSFDDLRAERQREIADLYRLGVDAADAGRRDDAIGYWKLVWNVAPDYKSVTDHLKQEYLARGLEAFSADKLDDAIALWEQALEVAPGDKRTEGYLARAYEHQSRIREIRNGNR